MNFNYKNLDNKTRAYMRQEVELDINHGKLYSSKRFNQNGEILYLNLIRDTVTHHDDEWLAHELSVRGCFKDYEERSRNGRVSLVKIPITAPQTFAEGEFNRFYCRGLCLRAIEEEISEVIVYRGKQVEHPRPESQIMIGKEISAQKLLDDLRNSQGTDTALGLPSGPNSGLTICMS